MSKIPFHERLGCTIAEAVEAVGIGRTKLNEEMNAGRIETEYFGKRRIVKVPSLLKRFGLSDRPQTSEAP